MFVLRRVLNKCGTVSNTCIGKSYCVYTKDCNVTQFLDVISGSNIEHSVDDMFGVLSCDDGGELIPLYNNSKYYVMTENGSTFERLINYSEKRL